jgi:hypothetical protein
MDAVETPRAKPRLDCAPPDAEVQELWARNRAFLGRRHGNYGLVYIVEV